MAAGSVKFQIKSNRIIPTLPGTRTLTSKSQLLTSSGIVSLDYVLGGGFPVGNIILVEEDEYGFYAKLFLKYFISEGLISRHSIFASSLDCDTRQMVEELPSPVKRFPSGQEETTGSSDDSLKIAWRYKDVTSTSSGGSSTNFGHYFDLASPLSNDIISSSEIYHYENKSSTDDASPYDGLLKALAKRVRSSEHSLMSPTGIQPARRKVLRVALHSLGSPLWGDLKTTGKQLTRFLYSLRALVRSSLTTCLITFPAHLFKEHNGLIERCEHLSDCVLRLESLAGNSNPCFSEYSGLLFVNKFSSVNTLAPHVPDTLDWAFKLRKRNFVIEKLHLPPELGETAQREQDEGPGCGSIAGLNKSALDF